MHAGPPHPDRPGDARTGAGPRDDPLRRGLDLNALLFMRGWRLGLQTGPRHVGLVASHGNAPKVNKSQRNLALRSVNGTLGNSAPP
ncbi:hypothetical protein LUTEI9C_70341 [Luteimonas sp. 9C]|nr:hypothetical protein LUTEI9C_70341 [Luteimonas sp. 9C]